MAKIVHVVRVSRVNNPLPVSTGTCRPLVFTQMAVLWFQLV